MHMVHSWRSLQSSTLIDLPVSEHADSDKVPDPFEGQCMKNTPPLLVNSITWVWPESDAMTWVWSESETITTWYGLSLKP